MTFSKRYPKYFSKHTALLAIVLLVLNLMFPASRVFAQAASDSQFFPETGKSVSGKFLQYWRSHGGLPIFGFPITDAQMEVDPETGKTFLTQWFERNRFELHPENAGTKYEVLLGLLGKDLRREAVGVDLSFVPAIPDDRKTTKDNHFFKETSHNLSGQFMNYWQSNGGLERFGFPISEAEDQVDPETGKVFLTQWFERARFEEHPENKGTQYEVLLGLLGKQLKSNPPTAEFKWELRRNGYPYGIALDNQANVWMAYENPTLIDTEPFVRWDDRLTKFDNQGHELSHITLPFDLDGYADVAMLVDKQGNLYLGERDESVQKIDQQGRSLVTFGKKGNGPREFQGKVLGLAVDRAGNLYVTNEGSSAINKYNPAGKFLTQIKGSPDDQFPLMAPSQLVIDGQGNLVIVDSSTGKVQRRDANGNFLSLLGDNCLGANAGSNDEAQVAVNQQGRLYILYQSSDFFTPSVCIERINSEGNVEVVFKDGGRALGQLQHSLGFAADNDDNLFVETYHGQGASVFLAKFHFR
jgi:sugar lactone lactonase YvrE